MLIIIFKIAEASLPAHQTSLLPIRRSCVLEFLLSASCCVVYLQQAAFDASLIHSKNYKI